MGGWDWETMWVWYYFEWIEYSDWVMGWIKKYEEWLFRFKFRKIKWKIMLFFEKGKEEVEVFGRKKIIY